MPKLLMIALTALVLQVPGYARADEPAERAAIEAALTALGLAFENEDRAAIEPLMTPDHDAIAWMYGGTATIDEQVALFPDVEYSVYDPTPPEITLLTPDVALVNYEISLDGVFRGRPLPSRVFVTQVWVKQDGKWLQRSHQETDIGGE